MRQYWLAKTEPETYSWDDMVREGEATWDGVRNYAARNNLMAMNTGDIVLIYHSINGKNIVGLAQVSKTHFPDPTDDTGKWSAVKMKPACPVNSPLGLEAIKQIPELHDMILLKNSRLSVQPVTEEQFKIILTHTGTNFS